MLGFDQVTRHFCWVTWSKPRLPCWTS